MAVKAGEKCLVLCDKVQNICIGEVYNSLYWLSEVVLENPITEDDFLNGSFRCPDDSVMMDLMAELSYNEFRVEGWGDIMVRVRYYSEDGKTYRLEEYSMEDMETGERTETQNMEFSSGIMYSGDETLTQFVQSRKVSFEGIYTAVEAERGDTFYDYEGNVVKVNIDTNLSPVPRSWVQNGTRCISIYKPNEDTFITYGTSNIIIENNLVYMLGSSGSDVVVHRIVRDSYSSSRVSFTQTGVLIADLSTDYLMGHGLKFYQSRNWISSNTVVRENSMELPFYKATIDFESQEIGIKTTSKQIAPGYRAYTDAGVVEGTLGKDIENNKDLWLIDSIMSNVQYYQPETLYQLYYKYEGDTIPSTKLLDTRKYNNLSFMFESAKASVIDVSHFEFEKDALADNNRWSLGHMFASNRNLQRIIGFNDMIAKMKKVSDSSTIWDTETLFEGCTSFNDSETVKNIDTTVITNLNFHQCSSLDLDTSLWDKSKITNLLCSGGLTSLTGMENSQLPLLIDMNFRECLFTEADFSNVNMPELPTFRQMFYGCPNLRTVKFRNFYAPKVQGFVNMFRACPNLETVDMYSSDNVYAIAYMDGFDQMFENCSKLKSVNLRGINFTKKTSSANPGASRMFSGCSALQFCDLGSMNLSSLKNYTNMFASVPNDCLIVVKDSTQKTWLQSKFSNLTNIKTVAEYGG